MTRFTQTVHRVALALSVLFGVLAVLVAAHYLRQHGGWDIESGSNDLMTILLLVLGFVLALSIAVLRPGARDFQSARLTSIVWTLALLLALFFTWHVIVVSNRWVDSVGTPIESPEALEAFQASYPASFEGYDYRVPTGVLLQSFEFLSANDVEMSGFVWQEYGPEIPDHVLRGVVLPEALDEAYQVEEAWRVERDGTEEIGWYFSGRFRQNFDYRLYPFDRQDIWLRIWSPEAVEGVLPVPDFDAYRDLTPESLPGVENQFVYGGWDPLRSGFSFDLIDYNVDFGLGYGFSRTPGPDLYFNLSVERDFLGPMLEHLVLEAAIAILLFFLLLLMAQDTILQDRIGLTIFDLIVAAGGLLFAVILDHNAIRGVVASQDLTYMEWFPLTLDVFIVLVVLTAVLRVRHWRIPVIGYSGDLMPVLAYWPALIGSLLAVTLLVFFY
ncbi:MAG TPA: hypothetical protein VHG52_09405 [Thermomicrobiales bacterium]|nr:hypothetical protein [Thermomicrobiales bacterium]